MNRILLIGACIAAFSVHAQESEHAAETSSVAQQIKEMPITNDKKMAREANINLQTTVTGNQEQPRVMYILPWQSPLSPELEIEMLSSQEDAVFGHVERDEMQRNLEAAGELDSPDE